MDVESLFREHHPRLYRYLVRLTGDPDAADDSAQEAFVRLIDRPPPGELQRAWLYRVATNVVLEDVRTRARRGRLLEQHVSGVPSNDAPDAQRILEAEERRRRVREALETLSPKERTALLLREEGFTHREIAEAVGTTTGSVGTLVARALERLAARLALDGAIE